MSLGVEKVKNAELIAYDYCGCSDLDFGSSDEVEHLFYDEFSERYFTSTIDKVLQAEYHLNRNLALGGIMTLNDWFEFLGLEKAPDGDTLGWSVCDSYYWLDFNHSKTVLDDGLECYLISMIFEPDPSALSYY